MHITHLFAYLLIVLIGLSGLLQSTSASRMPVLASPTNEIVCSLPLGEDGLSYQAVDLPETLPWGPHGLAVDSSGRFWVADTAAHRLIQFDAACQINQTIDTANQAVGITHLVISKEGLYALDSANPEPKVLHFKQDGTLFEKIPTGISLEEGLSGLSVDKRGVISADVEGGGRKTFISAPQGSVLVEAVIPEVLLSPAVEDAGDQTSAILQLGIHSAKIVVNNLLGGVRHLGTLPDGSELVSVEEVAYDGVIKVDLTVWKFTPTGELLGKARYPLAEQYIHLSPSLAIGPDGEVYATITRQDRVDLLRLGFQPDLPPILPTTTHLDIAAPADTDEITAIAPYTMISTARGYLYNSKYLSSTNINGVCAGRTKPGYLGNAGTYSSVSYDWGGFDTIAGFNGFMSPNVYQAGDINYAASESCSKGVDCSGYVSRVWGLTTKYSTRGLPGISTQLSDLAKLRRGDILNLYDSHVMLFSHWGVGGLFVYESTTDNIDRVTLRFRSWTNISGYVPRRYNNVSTDSCAGYYRAEYWNNKYLSGRPIATVCEGWPINKDWGTNGPGYNIGADNFSVRWVGQANFTGGNYTFIARSDDGMRVWLDNVLIIDMWRDQAPTETRVTRYVAAGEHSLQVNYYESGGGAVAAFRWEAASSTTSGNLALNRPSNATSSESSTYVAYKGNDGSTSTRWSSMISSTLGDQWWEVDLGGVTYDRVVIRWEAAYAAYHYVGWSSDCVNYSGYWYSISAPGSYGYNIGSHNNKCVAVLMRTRAPNMNNYSFYEFEVYRTVLLSSEESDEILLAEQTSSEVVEIQSNQILYFPHIER